MPPRLPPEQLSRALMVRMLSYRVQADALGDLPPATARLLDRLGRGEIAAIPLPERPNRPGTLLLREWDGTLQRVMVLERGFAWAAPPTTACRRWRRPSPAPTGTDHASSACGIGREQRHEA